MKAVSCVVAMDSKRGIGKNNALPWRIRTDLRYFSHLTSDVSTEGKQNVVVMGRRTWESIPAKYRPLSDRINVVLSKTLNHDDLPSDVLVRKSLPEMIEEFSSAPQWDKVESIYITGGHTVYKEAMTLPCCKKLFITEVTGDFGCDTFYPGFDTDVFPRSSDPRVPEGIKEENGIKFQFCVYERK